MREKPRIGQGADVRVRESTAARLPPRKARWRMADALPPVLAALCRGAGLGMPTSEYRFAPPRRWRFDWCWPYHHIAVEVEGGVWRGGRHTRGAGYIRDMQKYNAACLGGWRVLRYTPQQFTQGVWVADVQRLIGGAS